MSEPKSDWAKELIEWAEKNPPPPFEPNAWYNAAGDQIEVHFENVGYYGKWINHQLTLFCEHETGRIVGCEIVGIAPLLKRDAHPETWGGREIRKALLDGDQ